MPNACLKRIALRLCAAWRRWVVLGAWLGSASAATLAAAAQPSLLDHLQAALTEHPALHAADHTIAAARAAADGQRAALLPSIGLEFSSAQHDQRSAGAMVALDARWRSARHQAALAANVPLFRPAQQAAWARAQLGEVVAEADRDQQRQALIAQLTQAYFDWRMAIVDERSTVAELEAVRAQHASARARFEAGAATIIDEREAAARADVLSAQLLAAQAERRARALTLQSLSGLVVVDENPQNSPLLPANPEQSPGHFGPRLSDDSPTHASEEPSSKRHAHAAAELPVHWDWRDEAYWQDLAQTHPQLLRIRAQVAQAERAIDQARAEHAPQAHLQARWVKQSTPNGTLQTPALRRAHEASVGVVVSVPIFAGFAVQSAQAQAQAEYARASALLADAQRQITLAVAQAQLQTQSSDAMVSALAAARHSAALALSASERARALGMRQNSELLAARAAFFQAQRQWQRAQFQRLAAHIALRQAAGVLSVQDIADMQPYLKFE